MAVLNSAHIGAAIICGLFVLGALTLAVKVGLALQARRDHRARIEPCDTPDEFQHSPYGDHHD